MKIKLCESEVINKEISLSSKECYYFYNLFKCWFAFSKAQIHLDKLQA